MQNENSQAIIKRFFSALRAIIENKQLRGVKTFTDRYNINRRNFLELEKHPEKDMFELEWFAIICRDFGVNPYWLLSGQGEMFTSDLLKSVEISLKAQTSMRAV